ncbi:hypothetical protein EVAR_33884_1 [Eumeta japonica]|uniref:Uncharacterized protein n=1 Tax=Eumeta variegata TaxID=151549 RepID=A0A4C1WJE4_EUMVA|nr:hypothetical protein EVAR_33884_1 [Eumeta japonica]
MEKKMFSSIEGNQLIQSASPRAPAGRGCRKKCRNVNCALFTSDLYGSARIKGRRRVQLNKLQHGITSDDIRLQVGPGRVPRARVSVFWSAFTFGNGIHTLRVP